MAVSGFSTALIVGSVDVFACDRQRETLSATMLQTLMTLRGRPDTPR